ncbi:related to RTA1-involved in 7-aminocholesterol resistance [Phialocephala subalpina]|uniref:Related to RTA1-involved in 7-aminocholesterol resistance n=1 Tax=Phialocephala subalpina TaxID=576137 RepID=A0A1L7WUL5_9HELO|nr:related to RTA1-involved in 7-aminocholesterol resistance [Phialocephala subalpina]
MLLQPFALLATFLLSSTSAMAITAPPPTPTLAARQTTSASTTAIDFITTEYITIPGQTNDHVTLAPQTITIAVPTCIMTLTPDKNGYVPPGTCNALYDYYPSFAAAVVFSVLFGMLTAMHIVQAAMYKKKFCWVVIMGAMWEFASFATRAVSTLHQQSVALLLVSQLFVLLAPLWINAFAYMLLARLIHFFSPTHTIFRIPTAILSILFVSLDFISFVIQLVGGSYAGPTAPVDQQMKGVHIYMGGIGLQQFFIFVFLGLAVKFQREMRRLERMGPGAKMGWRGVLWTLYGSLGFITVRIFFRLIEFSGGKTSSNPLPFHEGYFYALEAMPMFFAIMCFNVNHPGRVLVGPESELPGLRETFWKKGRGGRRGKKGVSDESGEGLVGKYEMIEKEVKA